MKLYGSVIQNIVMQIPKEDVRIVSMWVDALADVRIAFRKYIIRQVIQRGKSHTIVRT